MRNVTVKERKKYGEESKDAEVMTDPVAHAFLSYSDYAYLGE